MAEGYLFIDDVLAETTEQPSGIHSRRILEDGALKGILFSFAAGEELSEHTAAVPATILTLRGRGRWTVAGDTFEAGPGSWLHLPAGQPHSVVAVEPLVMLLLLIKSAA